MKRQRRKFTGAEKVAILRRHLVEHISISEVCEQAGIQPTQFYEWQKRFFENGAAAFASPKGKKQDPAEKRIAALEAKLQKKNEVLGELMEEHVSLKKELGEL
jgi:transposase